MPDEAPHRKTVRKLNYPSHAHFLTFSCYRRMTLLKHTVWKEWLGESIRRACAQHDVALWAYVFMPEHVHLLLHPRQQKYNLSPIETTIKLSSSKRIINSLKEQNSSFLEKLRVRERPGKWCYRFWQEGGGHDKNVVSVKDAAQIATYCHNNPVKRGLVRDPADWRWSSFRWLEIQSRQGEPLEVDPWIE